MPSHNYPAITGRDGSWVHAGDSYVTHNTYVLGYDNSQRNHTAEQHRHLEEQIWQLQTSFGAAPEGFKPKDDSEPSVVSDQYANHGRSNDPMRMSGQGVSLPRVGVRSAEPGMPDVLNRPTGPGLRSADRLYAANVDPYGLTSVFLVPYEANDRFVDRPGELKSLSQYLLQDTESMQGSKGSRRSKQTRIALFGLGGVGKTQLAIEMAYRYNDMFPTHSVYWVHASSKEWLRHSFEQIAAALQLHTRDNEQSDIFMLVVTRLKQSSHNFLMIIDNADDTEVLFCARQRLADTLSECRRGKVLVTTRNKSVAEKITKYGITVQVTQMTETLACQLLQSVLPEDSLHTTEEAKTLAATLGYLPLALVQAAAYMREFSLTPKEYLEAWQNETEHATTLLSSEFETEGRQHFDKDVPNAVATTIMLSLDYLHGRTPDIGRLVCLVSLLNHTNIHTALLMEPDVTNPGLKFIEAIGGLQAFSLIEKNAQTSTLSVHSLIHTIFRQWSRLRFEMDAMARIGADLLSNLNQSFGRISGQADRSVADMQLPHALRFLEAADELDMRHDPMARTVLMRKIAEHMLFKGRTSEAAAMRSSMAQICRSAFGPQAIETLRAQCEYAEALQQLHQFTKVEVLCEEIIEASEMADMRRKTYINALLLLSRTLARRGRYKAALNTSARAIAAATAFFGHIHPDTVAINLFVAEVMRLKAKKSTSKRQSLLSRAEGTLRSTIKQLGKLKGKGNHLVILAKEQLASVLEELDDFQGAEKLYNEVVLTGTEMLGDTHLETFQARLRLALCFFKQQDLTSAKEIVQDALDKADERIDKHYLGRCKALQIRANIHESLGEQWRNSLSEEPVLGDSDWEDIKPQSEEGSKENENTSKPITASEREQWVRRCDENASYEYRLAYKLKKDVAAQLQEVPGLEHPHTLAHLIDLSRTCMYMFLLERNEFASKVKEAEKWQKVVLGVQSDLLGSEHEDTLRTRAILAVTLHEKGDLEAAQDEAETAFKFMQKRFGPGHRETLDMQHVLAEILYKQKAVRTQGVNEMLKCLQASLVALGVNDRDTQARQKLYDTWSLADALSVGASSSMSSYRMLSTRSLDASVRGHNVMKSTIASTGTYSMGNAAATAQALLYKPPWDRDKVLSSMNVSGVYSARDRHA